jgi:RNA polymerase sigma-70 factor (ECF subfamily)
MAEPSFNSSLLVDLVARWNLGDRDAANDLLLLASTRLEKLARRMCKAYPNVKEWAETQDVLQSSLVRLLRTLQQIDPLPATTRDFFNLAAVHIRRELIDLARHFRNKRCVPLDAPGGSTGSGRAHEEPAAPTSQDFERWERFHEAVEKLPAEEREVVGLVFYHGWTQAEIGELFQVDERTIRRRWAAACERLRDMVGDVPGKPAPRPRAN